MISYLSRALIDILTFFLLQKKICFGEPEITETQDYTRKLKEWIHHPVTNYKEYIPDSRPYSKFIDPFMRIFTEQGS